MENNNIVIGYLNVLARQYACIMVQKYLDGLTCKNAIDYFYIISTLLELETKDLH